MTTTQDIQVFISVKHLDTDGKPTRESLIARELYAELEAKGLISFLSLISLEAMGTAEYKGSIDDALDHADVLVAVGASPENLASRWVRYEWDSFFNDIISGVKPDGKVFSLISGFEPTRLPRALRQNQTFEYEQGGIEYLCNFLTNALELKQAIHERDEADSLRRKAENEAEKATAINDFLKDILQSADPFRGGKGYNTTVLEAITTAENTISERFKNQPEVESIVRHTLGTTYMHLGKYEEAKTLLHSSLDLCISLYGEDHQLTAEKHNEIGRLFHETGDYGPAESAFRAALEIYDKVFDGAHISLAATSNNLGILLRDLGRLDEAESLFNYSLDMKRELFGDVHEEVTPTLNNLGLLLHDQRKLAEAESFLEEALAANRQLCEPDHPTIGINLSNLGWVFIDQRLYKKAEERFRESLSIKIKRQGDSHPSTGISISGLATALEGQGFFSEAHDGFETAIDIFSSSLPANHWRLAYTQSLYARCMIRSDRVEQGKKLLEESIASLDRILGPDHPKTREAIATLQLA